MIESLANPINTLDLITGNGAAPEYVPSASRIQIVWSGSKTTKDDAIAAGYTVDDTTCLVGLSSAGIVDYAGFNPFNFYLLKAQEVQIKCNSKGEVIDYKVGSEQIDGYRQSYVTLGVAVRGRQLVPWVAGLGRLAGGTGGFVRQAQLVIQRFTGDLTVRGKEFETVAGIQNPSFRVKFRLGGKAEESDNGKYLKTKVSHVLTTADDLAIMAENDIMNPNSQFQRDLAECAKVFQQELTKKLDK